MDTPFLYRLEQTLMADLKPVKWLLGWAAVYLALGFWTAEVSTDNYLALKQFAPVAAWAALFTVYGLDKLYSCLFDTPFFTKVLSAVVGLYLWGYLVISFVFFDATDVQATEYMLIFPLLCELWVFSKLIFDVIHYSQKR